MSRLAYSCFLTLITLALIDGLSGTSFADPDTCPTTTTEPRIPMWEKVIATPISGSQFETCSQYLHDIYYKPDNSGYAQRDFDYSTDPLNNPILIKVQEDFKKLKSNHSKKPTYNPSSSFDSGFLTETEFIVDRLIDCSKIGNSNPIRDAHHSVLVSEAFKIWFEAMNTVGLDGFMHGERYKRVLGELQPTLEFYKKEKELGFIKKTGELLDKVDEKEEFWHKNRPCPGVTPPAKCANPITEEYFRKFLEPNKEAFKKDYDLYKRYDALEKAIKNDIGELNKEFSNLAYTPPPPPPAESPRPVADKAYIDSIPPSPEEMAATTIGAAAAPATAPPTPKAEEEYSPPPPHPAEYALAIEQRSIDTSPFYESLQQKKDFALIEKKIMALNLEDRIGSPTASSTEPNTAPQASATPAVAPTEHARGGIQESINRLSALYKQQQEELNIIQGETERLSTNVQNMMERAMTADSNDSKKQGKTGTASKSRKKSASVDDYFNRVISFIVNYKNESKEPYAPDNWKQELRTDLIGWKSKINRIKDTRKKREEENRFHATLKLLKANLHGDSFF